MLGSKTNGSKGQKKIGGGERKKEKVKVKVGRPSQNPQKASQADLKISCTAETNKVSTVVEKEQSESGQLGTPQVL